jgi:hypothetical protein
MWILKLDSNGGVGWQQTYGGQGSHAANFVRQISDGGYIVAGEKTSSFGAGGSDAWVLKLDGRGNIGSGCSVIGTSTAIATAAGFAERITSINGTPTAGLATSTSASPVDSVATTTTQCSFP